jgi:hypothetical protein
MIIQYNNIIRQGGKERKIQDNTRQDKKGKGMGQGKGQGKARQYNII